MKKIYEEILQNLYNLLVICNIYLSEGRRKCGINLQASANFIDKVTLVRFYVYICGEMCVEKMNAICSLSVRFEIFLFGRTIHMQLH